MEFRITFNTTVLHSACLSNNPDLVKYLLSLDKFDVDLTNRISLLLFNDIKKKIEDSWNLKSNFFS